MLERTELEQLRERGFHFEDPFEVIGLFESMIAEYVGASEGIAVDSCTHALELSLRYLKASGVIEVPRRTYLSVPMTVLKLGGKIRWVDLEWKESYALTPYPVIDAGVGFRKDSYTENSFMCLSFQQKKTLPIGRGGMILTSDKEAAHWLRKASYDGRTRGRLWKNDPVEMLGYHYYMTPEDAARGILLFQDLLTDSFKFGGSQDYPDLSGLKVFKDHGD